MRDARADANISLGPVRLKHRKVLVLSISTVRSDDDPCKMVILLRQRSVPYFRAVVPPAPT